MHRVEHFLQLSKTTHHQQSCSARTGHCITEQFDLPLEMCAVMQWWHTWASQHSPPRETQVRQHHTKQYCYSCSWDTLSLQ